jgi:hypothetical protein
LPLRAIGTELRPACGDERFGTDPRRVIVAVFEPAAGAISSSIVCKRAIIIKRINYQQNEACAMRSIPEKRISF